MLSLVCLFLASRLPYKRSLRFVSSVGMAALRQPPNQQGVCGGGGRGRQCFTRTPWVYSSYAKSYREDDDHSTCTTFRDATDASDAFRQYFDRSAHSCTGTNKLKSLHKKLIFVLVQRPSLLAGRFLLGNPDLQCVPAR